MYALQHNVLPEVFFGILHKYIAPNFESNPEFLLRFLINLITSQRIARQIFGSDQNRVSSKSV